jgi:formylglycine-generating enzyme required for sulfatase activity
MSGSALQRSAGRRNRNPRSLFDRRSSCLIMRLAGCTVVGCIAARGLACERDQALCGLSRQSVEPCVVVPGFLEGKKDMIPRLWYVAKNKQRLGPFAVEQLSQMADAGTLQPNDMTLEEGKQTWCMASEIERIFPVLAVPVESPCQGETNGAKTNGAVEAAPLNTRAYLPLVLVASFTIFGCGFFASMLLLVYAFLGHAKTVDAPADKGNQKAAQVHIPPKGEAKAKIEKAPENQMEPLAKQDKGPAAKQDIGNLEAAAKENREAEHETKKEEAIEPNDPPKRFANSLGMKFVWIPPGTFMMGSPKGETQRVANETQHKVTLSKGFYMGIYTVTQEQWKEVMGNNPSFFKAEKNLPVESVSWDDCQEFIKKLREKDKKRYRLPTEAEWEYACRAGTTTPFYFGETISTDQANYHGDFTYGSGKKGKYREKTTPVGSFQANAWGLHDMHGNVEQWCQDWFGDYPQNDIVDPQGPNGGQYRVLRGGSCDCFPESCRSAYRIGHPPGFRDIGRDGIRLCFFVDNLDAESAKALEPAKSPQHKEQVAEHKSHEEVSVGSFTYKVSGAVWSSQVEIQSTGYRIGPPNASYLLIVVSIRNNDKESKKMPGFSLLDGDGATHDMAKFFTDKSTILNPGVTTTVCVVFDVVKENKKYRLRVYGNTGWADTKLIKIEPWK